MFAALAQLSLCEIVDSAPRAEHAARLQLRRLPLLRLQAGIAGAEGWARDRVASGSDAGEFARVAFAELFWLHENPALGLAALQEAVATARRATDTAGDGIRRALDAAFVPLKGYVLPRVLVGPDALPYRPTRAIHLELTRSTRHDRAADELFHWHDQVRIPALLRCRGVAGAWSFATASLFRPGRDVSAPALRLVIVYLDGEPEAFAADLAALPPREGAEVEQVVLASTLRTIVPWRWDSAA